MSKSFKLLDELQKISVIHFEEIVPLCLSYFLYIDMSLMQYILKLSRNKKNLSNLSTPPFSVSFSQLPAAKKHTENEAAVTSLRSFLFRDDFNNIKNLVKSLEHGISDTTSKRCLPQCSSRAIVSYCIPKRSSVRPSFLTRIFFGIPHFTLVDLISLETWNLEMYFFVTNVKSFV